MRSVNSTASFLLALTSFVTIAYGIQYVFNTRVLLLPPQLMKAGPTQFLTNLSGILTNVYYLASIVAYLTKSKSIFYAKNNYILPIVLSLEFIVTTVYWSLKLFFTHLIVMVDNVPVQVDFCLHFIPFASLLIDYLVFLPQFDISNSFAVGLCAVLAVGYWNWLEYLIDPAQGQLYPYPFLNIDRNKRMGVFVFVALLAFAGFLVMRGIHSLLVSEEVEKKKED